MNRYTNAQLVDIHFIYRLVNGNDVLLFGCMGKDIQRGSNQIIKRSLRRIRTWWNVDLSEARFEEVLTELLSDVSAPVRPRMWFQQDGKPTIMEGVYLTISTGHFQTGGLGVVVPEIGSHVGRNQTTVMRICDRWMQEGTTDRRGRSHPPQCTTSREDRQIVRMAMTDRSVTSRTVTQPIESVTHHSVSARNIRHRLEQSGLSARRSLLGLPLTQNHRRLRHQWCDERRMWAAEWNEVVFTDESRICLQHHDGRIRVWRHRGERMLNSCSTTLVLHRGLATAIFQQDNARPHVARIVQRLFVSHQIELLPWPARSLDLSPIENMWSMVAQRLTQITPPANTPDQLWQRGEAAWSAVPQEHIQSLFESMPRRVAAVISNNGGYSGY
ncbi:transposable element Tc1 transposase [Trichonephila clavipes]|nr:transposable element Tc1 transposase [Trichonephila clavipes]